MGNFAFCIEHFSPRLKTVGCAFLTPHFSFLIPHYFDAYVVPIEEVVVGVYPSVVDVLEFWGGLLESDVVDLWVDGYCWGGFVGVYAL